MNYETINLIDNKANHHFELWSNEEHAFIDYTRKNDTVFLIHTEVPKRLQGTGMGEAIVQKTLNYLEAQHQKIVPYCAYVKAFLKRHPEWDRLLAV